MPPSNRPSFERLYECESELCIQRLVDEYIYDLINGNEWSTFKLLKDDEISDDKFVLNEKVMLNSYLFIRELLKRVIETDLDFEYIVTDLEKKLGNTHPVVLFLKQFRDD
ncbi:hypothetical protein [Saccharolobus caldissimus]|uniref:Uncharacterized protein n=1 Tax=Saccharolobus caldissimus TaxID=1702097 RepID=A0AAQ4CWR3_9CREN|nr:hypothetical protein [Saccharolobus caldissimus]BDC00245.1 hypothetical protein SACC_32610 [Saccharolobus caldissimus]